MNKKGFWAVVIGFVLVFVLFLSASDASFSESDKTNDRHESIIIKAPRNLSFAGESVPVAFHDVQESLERELISNTYFHSQTIFLLKKTNRFFPTIERILKKNGIPEDFKYLAVAESILFNKAKSPVGAAGVWQLMESTAQELGLEVNDNVDERYNLELATEAACQFLLASYEKFGNWTLVAASYNMGRRALDRTMAYQKQDNYYDLYMNTETARYVYRILAFKLILTHPERYGFNIDKDDQFKVLDVDTVLVDYPIEHLADFAVEQKMNYKTLKLLNPWFLENHLNNASHKKYKILVSDKR